MSFIFMHMPRDLYRSKVQFDDAQVGSRGGTGCSSELDMPPNVALVMSDKLRTVSLLKSLLYLTLASATIGAGLSLYSIICWVIGEVKMLRIENKAARLTKCLSLCQHLILQSAEQGSSHSHLKFRRTFQEPQVPRLALSRTSKSASDLVRVDPSFWVSRFHFHWEKASVIGVMKAALHNVVKKARNVLRVTCSGSFGRDRPSYAPRTAMITAVGS